MYVVLRTVEILHKIQLFFFHFLIWTHSINILYVYWQIRRNEGKRNYDFPISFSFYVIIFSVSGWLIQRSNMSKIGNDRLPWWLYRKSTLGVSVGLLIQTAAMELKDDWSLEKSYDKPRQYIKMQRYHLANNDLQVKAVVFPVVTYGCWELGHKEGRVPKNWCFWTVVLKTTLESPLNCKEIKPVNPKGNQSWIFTGRIDVEAEVPTLWPPDVKRWKLTGKDPDTGKDWGQEKKGVAGDEMVRWHHRLNGHEYEQTLGDSEGQGSLVCSSPWGLKELDMIKWVNINSHRTLWHFWTCQYTGKIPQTNNSPTSTGCPGLTQF